MPSFRTFFRAVVMAVVVAVGVKAWHLYGPTNEQVKSAVTQGIEMVQSAIQSRQQSSASITPDPRVAAPAASNSNLSPAPLTAAPVLTPQSAPLTQTEAPKLLPESGASPAAAIQLPPATPESGDRLPTLMSRLQQLGAADTNLAAWGNGGNLFRFTCRAPLANAPTMTQHFESVAAEPALAVEQVIAKVEAWQVAQRDGGQLRY